MAPMDNTYLGSIAWGWETDDTGTTTLNSATLPRAYLLFRGSGFTILALFGSWFLPGG
jgi:hypothetical protein